LAEAGRQIDFLRHGENPLSIRGGFKYPLKEWINAMWGRKGEERREIMEAWKPRIKKTAEAILNGAEIVGRAALFVLIVLAIELCVVGLCYVACGR